MRDFLRGRLEGSRLERPVRSAYVRVGLGRAPSWADRRNREYDRRTVEIIRRTVRQDSSTVDAGANEGLLLSELLRAAPLGTHYAFEPIPVLAERLRTRHPAAVVHQVALADRDGEARFRYLPENGAQSSLHVRPDREDGRTVVDLMVSVQRLDTVLDSDVQVDFVKVDVEGAERDLLRGARGLLRRCQPVVVVECHSDDVGELADVLEDADLSLSLVDDFLDGRRRARQQTEAIARRDGEFYFVGAP